ncbi:hypothetical protein GCM10011534_21520 [Pseudooceanicola nanhaiensis]|jgi:branched-subunit amino acid transport protein|uniref:Branched-chain amino acid transport protein n=1 Tax=Pseudooceanicola nanhaiensis TaxID=375761 RepID=A0A917SX81_9RHOB|nr:AzlD domain-containing protein [Pseudooceanicola nanhaiensis]GGL99368.1 hypothetical protein GCM10011534_21520 [Pseudooceanicola nanhaiensis]
MSDHVTLWLVIAGLALGSFGLRFVFLGLVGNRAMPAWLLRHLRYTAVAILPALVAPLVAWPAATGGEPDPARLGATFVTLGVGIATRNVFAGLVTGAATLFILMAWLG